MVRMAINNLHPDSITLSVVAYSLDNALVKIIAGTGVVVPHKISELEYVVHSEVVKYFKDYELYTAVKTDLIFDQNVVEVKVFRLVEGTEEYLFSVTADRWKNN